MVFGTYILFTPLLCLQDIVQQAVNGMGEVGRNARISTNVRVKINCFCQHIIRDYYIFKRLLEGLELQVNEDFVC